MVDINTTDLLKSIVEKFSLWMPNELSPPSFIQGLLKNKNLVVFVDALSESGESMQEYINNIHSRLPVNAMIITPKNSILFPTIILLLFLSAIIGYAKLAFSVRSYIEVTISAIYKQGAYPNSLG